MSTGGGKPLDLFSGITDWFNCICEPQACGPRASFDDFEPASNAPPRFDDARFAQMASDDGIQQSFRAYSSNSAHGRVIERSSFPAFCRHFFTRIDPSYTLTSDDMNLLWEFFDRQREGRLDIFQFGVAVKQLLPHRAGMHSTRARCACQKSPIDMPKEVCMYAIRAFYVAPDGVCMPNGSYIHSKRAS